MKSMKRTTTILAATTLAATTPAKALAKKARKAKMSSPLRRLSRLGGRALLVVPGALFQAAEYTGEILVGAASVAATVGKSVVRATRAHGRRVIRGKAPFA